MNIIKKTTPNFTKGREGKTPKLLIIHWIGAGDETSTVNWFANSKSQVSAHYLVADDRVYQFVDEKDTAWQAGDRAVNTESIGIEHEATPTYPLTETSYKTSGQLVKEIATRWSIPLDREHIKKHSEIKSTQCPGTIDIDKIIAIAKGGFMDTDIPTEVEEKYKLKEIERYNKYWTYEQLIEDWVKLVKEVDYERTAKEDYKKTAEQYKETCTSQAEQIAKLGEEIKALSQALADSKANILQLQGQFVEVSKQRDDLLDVVKVDDNKIQQLLSENVDLTTRLGANPLGGYSTKQLIGVIIGRILGRS